MKAGILVPSLLGKKFQSFTVMFGACCRLFVDPYYSIIKNYLLFLVCWGFFKVINGC